MLRFAATTLRYAVQSVLCAMHFTKVQFKLCSKINMPPDTAVVTQQGVHTTNTTDVVATWNAPDPLSIATSCGSLLALAHGHAVTVVKVEAVSGEVTNLRRLQYSQQVSAAALLQGSDGRPEVRSPSPV